VFTDPQLTHWLLGFHALTADALARNI